MANTTGSIQNNITESIYYIREQQVMLDSHLALLYEVETKNLNRAVARNLQRFPSKFMFQLNAIEWENLRFQFGTSGFEYGGRRHLPYVFTEQGVAMLSAILRSQTAINVSIQIIEAFIRMRRTINNYGMLFERISKIESKQGATEEKFEKIFELLELKEVKLSQGIFYNGQIFDAYNFLSELIRRAKKSIILIDNYVDETTLTHLSKRKNGVSIKIFTKMLKPSLQLDIIKFNKQYGNIFITELKNCHDRFLIIDESEIYHLGASLKDAGIKTFAFSKLNLEVSEVLPKLLNL